MKTNKLGRTIDFLSITKKKHKYNSTRSPKIMILIAYIILIAMRDL